ncbi:DUF937 domain-containing protein [Deinococcus radiophilus]|nr:DUF937 domain-containing protein [Deinococcus radiophilus]UFA50073.1 DUF937 domain-containing protein [Deinococcus radiophilus]
MNIEELFRQHFGADSARQLGSAAGLTDDQAARLLDRTVRWQLETLAQQAKSEGVRSQITEAIDNLPRFRDVAHGLQEQGGADSLQLAGEILSPGLLGSDQSDMAGQLARVEGAPQPAIARLLNMSLPLLLSFAGQAGLNRDSMTQIMSTIRASGVRPRAVGGSYVSRAGALSNAPQFRDQGNGGETKKSPEAPQASSSRSQVEMSAAGVRPSQPEAVSPTQAERLAQSEPVSSQPQQVAGTNYSKDSVASALLEDAEVPSPEELEKLAQARNVQPAAPVTEAPQSAVVPTEPVPEPELVPERDYSKDSVVSALLEDAEAPAVTTPAPPTAEPTASVAPQPTAAVTPAPVAHTQPSSPVQPAAPAGAPTASAQPDQRPAPAADALAAAAAAAGVGGGAVQAAQPAPQGSNPWKSAKPVVSGSQPSQAQPARAAAPAPAAPRAVPVAPAAAAVSTTSAVAQPAAQDQALSADNLLTFFREQFSGEGTAALAEATGFGRRDAGRAVQGTVPVLLSALAQKGHNEAGAAELLSLSNDFGRVVQTGGLNMDLLSNRAELGAMEVRGLSVLDRLLDNPGEVGGRLGTALGTSGEQAGRLLALLTPFVLGLLGSRAQATRTDAAGLSRVLAGLTPGKLEGLLPQGMGVLKALLGAQLFGAAPKARPTLLETKQAKATPLAEEERVVVKEQPAPAVQPMTPEPPRPVTPPPAEPERGGFPWWIIPLLLLAGLAWYFTQNRAEPVPAPTPAATEQTTTPPAAEPAAAAPEAALTVLEPADGTTVAADGFSMTGTGGAGDYEVFENGTSVGSFTAESDGAWTTDITAPAVGDNTYAIWDESGNEVATVNVTVE